MRVNYVEGAILDGNEKKQGEKDAKEKGKNLFDYEFYENEMSLDCLDSDRGDDREALLRQEQEAQQKENEALQRFMDEIKKTA